LALDAVNSSKSGGKTVSKTKQVCLDVNVPDDKCAGKDQVKEKAAKPEEEKCTPKKETKPCKPADPPAKPAVSFKTEDVKKKADEKVEKAKTA